MPAVSSPASANMPPVFACQHGRGIAMMRESGCFRTGSSPLEAQRECKFRSAWTTRIRDIPTDAALDALRGQTRGPHGSQTLGMYPC